MRVGVCIAGIEWSGELHASRESEAMMLEHKKRNPLMS